MANSVFARVHRAVSGLQSRVRRFDSDPSLHLPPETILLEQRLAWTQSAAGAPTDATRQPPRGTAVASLEATACRLRGVPRTHTLRRPLTAPFPGVPGAGPDAQGQARSRPRRNSVATSLPKSPAIRT